MCTHLISIFILLGAANNYLAQGHELTNTELLNPDLLAIRWDLVSFRRENNLEN
jgi:hypothetical protein